MANPGDGVGISLRVKESTIALWLDKASDFAMQNYPLMGLLKAKGKLRRVTGGGQIRWVPEISYPDLDNLVNARPMEFSPHNPLKNATLPWATYTMQQTITPQERAQNAGEAQKVALLQTITRNLQNGAVQRLGPKFYVDGNLTGNELEWHGLESIFSMTGQAAADELATTLNDTYGGLSTAYAGLVPSAASGEPGYDAWSPVLVSTNRTPTGGSQMSWESDCLSFMRLMVRKLCYSSAAMDQPDLGVLTEEAHRQACELLEATHRVALGPSLLETKYGFKPVGGFNFEGVTFYWDRAVPATDANSDEVQGYVLNTNRMELLIQNSDVPGAIKGKGEASIFEFWKGLDPFTLNDLFRLLMFSNIRMESPRYFGKFAGIA